MDMKHHSNDDNCLLLSPERLKEEVASNHPSPSAPLKALIALDSEVETLQPPQSISPTNSNVQTDISSKLNALLSYVRRHQWKLMSSIAGLFSPALLPLIGFTRDGIRRHSIATSIQSKLDGAHTSGIFSIFQKAGCGQILPIIQVAACGCVSGFLICISIEYFNIARMSLADQYEHLPDSDDLEREMRD
ncbi:predicted protein [Chaetoceros tenuissimus]|uniref:Uncharacterized protein n=1 Tax=Chaetoceros tenuissimus TaxID=426638 RepID=A0AAD3CSH2_9STRA|nr:predicted protein [Chaetoceros tenuissimus]